MLDFWFSLSYCEGIEINLQTAQLTLKTSHLKALDRKIAQRPDCVEVFGSQSMQCAVIESAKNRELVRLIGRWVLATVYTFFVVVQIVCAHTNCKLQSHCALLNSHPRIFDCVEVFGSQSMQCAVIESAKNRELVRLIGRWVLCVVSTQTVCYCTYTAVCN